MEVGCLEEVLTRMAVDQDGSWGSVMFIPKGEAAAEHPLSMSLLLCVRPPCSAHPLRCWLMLCKLSLWHALPETEAGFLSNL